MNEADGFAKIVIGADTIKLVFRRNYNVPIGLQIRFTAWHEEHQGLPIRQPR